MKLGAWLAGLLVVVCSTVAAADAPPRTVDRSEIGSSEIGGSAPRGIDELRAEVAEILRGAQIPGAGIALIDGDRVLWAGGVGVADRATGRPVTADTLFRVGSITKSFVAMALVRLAEQGRVALGTPVAALAPELAIENRWAAEQPITVAHLLEHTAGFDDMHLNEMFGPLAVEQLSLAAVLAHNPASRVARWRPGSRFSYANPGYTVAGYVIEKVTGRPYEDVIARELLAPMGMTGAALRWSPEVDARLARGYGAGDDPVPYAALYHRPAGNLMASPRELAALVRLAIGRGRIGGRTVISPAGMARIERSETAWLDGGDLDYGLGNGGDAIERAPIRGHDGGIPGFLSVYGYLPGQGVGFVLLVNSTRSVRAVIAIRHLLVEYLLRGRVVPPPPRAVVPEAELARWAGTYHTASPRHQLLAFLDRLTPGIELYVERGQLFARTVPAAGPPVELIPLGGDRFRLPRSSGADIRLGRDREGRRIAVAHLQYLVEEPRARSLAFAVAPQVFAAILLSALVWPLGLLRRQVGPAPGFGWALCVIAASVAVPRLFVAGLDPLVLGELNRTTLGICAGTLVFALGSVGSLVQALRWLPLPGSAVGKLHRLVFGVATCCATAYLAAYGIIGIRLWSY